MGLAADQVYQPLGIVLLQLLVGEVGPGRVVGAGVDHGGDVAAGHHLLELGLEFGAAVVVDVERRLFQAEDVCLGGLCGEAGVEEQHGVLLGIALAEQEHEREAALHGAYGGDDALGGDVHAQEGLYEALSGLLELGDAADVGILVGHAGVKGRFLGFHAHLGGWKTGVADLQVHHLFSGDALGLGGHGTHLADGGLGQKAYAAGADGVVELLGGNREHGLLALFE